MTNTETAVKTTAPMETGGALAAFVPQDSTQLIKLAQVLAQSGDLIPKHYQNNWPAIAAAMMRGLEVGLPPMQALSSIAVINGRPTVWGDAIPALLQKAGHHIDVAFEGQGDKLVAIATLTRGDSGRKVVRQFSIEDAKRAGLMGKPGPWQQYTSRMLAMRARTWAARDGAADALMGLHVREEVQDYGPDAARDVTPRARPPRTSYVTDPEPDDRIEEHDAPPPDDVIEAAMEEARREAAAAADLFTAK